MNTLLEVLSKCKQRCNMESFEYTPQGLKVEKEDNKFYQPADLKIIKTYRFEGMNKPDDSSITLVILRKPTMAPSGPIIDSYGAYSSHDDEQGF